MSDFLEAHLPKQSGSNDVERPIDPVDVPVSRQYRVLSQKEWEKLCEAISWCGRDRQFGQGGMAVNCLSELSEMIHQRTGLEFEQLT